MVEQGEKRVHWGYVTIETFEMFEDDTTLELWSAIHHDTPQELKELISIGVDINKADRNGQTPLHAAVSSGHDRIVKILIKAGADVNQENENGQTPLHLASSLGYSYIVMKLIKAQCDVNRVTKYSEMTALHMASRSGHSEVVKILLEHGADNAITDAIGKPPEFYAGTKEIAGIFQSIGERLYYRRKSQQQHELSDILSKMHKHEDRPHAPRKSSVDHNERKNQSSDNVKKITTESVQVTTSRKQQPKKKKVVIVDHKLEYSDQFKKRMNMSVFDRLSSKK